MKRFSRIVRRCTGRAAWVVLATTIVHSGLANDYAESSLNVGGSRVDVALDARLQDAQEGPWHDWLTTSIAAVAGVAGEFPAPELAVTLEATPGRGAVVFGRVRRGDPPHVHFYVNPQADLPDLIDDWRGYHEFAHLLLPYPGSRDRWFSEGLASYYQYLLQARAGVIDPGEAWRRLFGGFERGFSDPVGRGETLRDLTPRMQRERAFRRVYWTGAAYFLRVDVRLRLESNGEHSLDTALAAFHECCMDDSRRRWTARALIRRLGRLSMPEIWEEEYRRMIDAPAEPDFGEALDALGIRVGDDRVYFSSDPGARALRRAIAAPSPVHCPPDLVSMNLEE